MVLSLRDEEYLHIIDNEVNWVTNTKTSYHATPTKVFFTSYKVGDFGTVKIGNTSYSKIARICDVCI